MADMLRHANLVVTAWEGKLLVGIARSLTDFSYVACLADLAVRESGWGSGWSWSAAPGQPWARGR